MVGIEAVTHCGAQRLARLAGCMFLLPAAVMADGFTVDRIYQPYVQPYEREFEYRALYLNDADAAIDGTQVHRLSYGHALSDRWFVELYVIGANEPDDSLALEGYEAEVKWQLTEQGEYFADWGLLFELEYARDPRAWEYSTTVLFEKELGRWSATVNASLAREWGSQIQNEWETEFAGQMRYRYRPVFEPNVALYSSENVKGIGPGAQGIRKFSGGRNLQWQLNLVFGIDGASPDQAILGVIEYEF